MSTQRMHIEYPRTK